jgi:high-affinity iron transporter
MLQSLVVSLREGVEAALIVGIAIIYLRKTGRQHSVKIVYLALGAAIAASIAGAVLLQRISLNQEAFEGYIFLLSAVFVATMLYWMNKTARGLKGHIEQRLEHSSSESSASTWGIFLFVFFMVLREGIETVLILSAVTLNTSDLLEFSGAIAGLALATIFAVLFLRGSIRVDIRRFFQITTIILVAVIAQLVISGLHELSEAGVVPSNQQLMALIGPIVSHDIFFIVLILALAGMMILFDWRSRAHEVSAAGSTRGAEHRATLHAARRDKLWTAAVCSTTLIFIMAITAEFIYANGQTALSPATPVTDSGGIIRIPLAEVSDGELHRFSYQGTDISARFIVIKTGDHIGTAFDACVICGSQGYYQKGPHVFCKNCTAEIYAPSIGVTGGCNPVPLTSHVSDTDLQINVTDLAAGNRLFAAHTN